MVIEETERVLCTACYNHSVEIVPPHILIICIYREVALRTEVIIEILTAYENGVVECIDVV